MKKTNYFYLVLLALTIFSSCSKNSNEIVTINFADLDSSYDEAVAKMTSNSNFKVVHNDIELVFNDIKTIEGIEIENNTFIGNENENDDSYIMIDNVDEIIYIQYNNKKIEYEFFGSSNTEAIKGISTNKQYNVSEINNSGIDWLAQSTQNSIVIRKNLESLEQDFITLLGESLSSCGVEDNIEQDTEHEHLELEPEDENNKSEWSRRVWDIKIVRNHGTRLNTPYAPSVIRTYRSWRYLSVGSYHNLNNALPYQYMHFYLDYYCVGAQNCVDPSLDRSNSSTVLNNFRTYVLNNYTDRSDVIYVLLQSTGWDNSINGRAYYGKTGGSSSVWNSSSAVSGVRVGIASLASNTTMAHEIGHTLKANHHVNRYREVDLNNAYKYSFMYTYTRSDRYERCMDWRQRNKMRTSLNYDI